MSATQSYERVLGMLAAEARIGRPGRTLRRSDPSPEDGDVKPAGRAWINGREVGGPNPRFAHLHRSCE
jgi:hypothetical protein